MSTIGWREPGLAQAVASILPQVDRLNVFLQGYSSTPACLDDPKVRIVRDVDAPESAALGASAKFHWQWHGLIEDGHHFIVDDDIEYPPDYVATCISKIEQYGRRVVVGYHGAIYHKRMRSYFRDRDVWTFGRENDDDRFVHIIGTGTSAFHTSTLRLRRDDFAQANSCDLYLGIACQKQRVPMLCLARPREYLKALPLATEPRAVSAPDEYAQRMVRIHDSWDPWIINRCPPVPGDVVVVIPCYNESRERIERTVASALATHGVDRVRVVDDGSAVPVVLEGVEVIRRDVNGGPSAALNTGIRSLPADSIVCRLDVGDVFYPEPKSRQIAMVKAGAQAVCSWRYDPVGDRVCPIADGWETAIYRDCQFSLTAAVFTKSAWFECGEFDDEIRWTDDWRFAAAMQAHIGWTVFPEVTGEHGEHPGGHSDVSGDPERRKMRQVARARVVNYCAALGDQDRHAHLFNARWCEKRGIKPMKRPNVRR